jgi:TBC1 domain family member 5
MADERPVEERPAREVRTRFEMERDISEVRSRDKSLGESLAWIVDILLQDESEAQDAQSIKMQKREALESLSYVRDVLMLNTMKLDEDRLIGGEERLSRKQKLEKKTKELRAVSAAAAAVSAPVPVQVVDSRTKHRSRSPISFASAPNVTLPRAPWNGGSAVTMPRPPPPTSTNLRREGKKNEGFGDPLGASRK